MRLLCDVDGVLADFVGGMCKHLPGREPHNFTAFEMEKVLTVQEQDIFNCVYNDVGFCLGLDWYAGAMEFAAALPKNTLFVTAPNTHSQTWHVERQTWLKPIAKPAQIVFCAGSVKPRVTGDILIEDNKSTAEAWVKAQGGLALLINRPWNGGSVEPGVIRCFSYEEATALIRLHTEHKETQS